AVFVGLKNLTGSGTKVSIETAAGASLGTSTPGATNFDQSINYLVLATGGTYYLRVDGSAAATYSLVTAKNAAFDTEANDSFGTAQDLHGLRTVLGQGGTKNLLYGATSSGQLFTVNLATGAG